MRLATAIASLAVAASMVSALPSKQDFDQQVGQHGNDNDDGRQPKRFGILLLENTDYDTANANPVFQKIYSYGRELSQYYGVTHPSLPNYLATVAGTYFGVQDDKQYNLTAGTTSVVDLLEAHDVDWKVYAEDYPGNCYLQPIAGGPHHYAEKHVPHLEFVNNQTPERCAKIVPSAQFWDDVKNEALPPYWYYVPNLTNDGHDSNTSFVASYLQDNWLPLFEDKHYFMKHQALLVTYDESETYSKPNHIYAALVGSVVTNSSADSTYYDHYSYLRSVEDALGLGTLGRNDTNATPFKYN